MTISLSGAGVATATDYQWNGTTNSSWNTASNWSASTGPAYGGTYTADRLQVYNATNPVVYDPVADGAGAVTTTFGGAGSGGGTSGRGLVIGNTGFGDGALTVNSGTLKIGGTANALMANAQNASLTVNGGLMDLTSTSGTALIVLFGGSNAVTSTTTLNGGELRTRNIDLNSSNTNAGSTSSVTLNTGAVLTCSSFVRSSTAGNSTVTFAGGTLRARVASTTFFNDLSHTTTVVNGAGAIIDSNGFDVTIAKPLTAGTGTGALTKTGTGTLTLSGASTYAGGTVVNQGFLTFANATALPTTGNVSVNGEGSLTTTGPQTTVTGWLASGRLDTASTGAIAITAASSENIDFTGFNSLGLSAAGTFTYSGTITPGTGGYRFGGGPNSLLTVSSSLADQAGATGLTKYGAGTLTLSGTNAYSGGTTVTAGTLAAGSAAPFGSGSVTLAGGGLSPGGQNVSNNIVLAGLGTLSGTGTLSGVISESGGARSITSSGTITLSGANTYTGDTTITGGILTISHPNALGAAGGVNSVTTDGAVLALAGNITVTGENISITGTANARGALQSFFGNNTFAGNVTIANAATRIGSQDGADLTVSGTITGTGANSSLVFRPGAGRVVTLSGTGNSWAGSTSTFGGILRNGVNNAVSTGSVMSMGFGGVLTTDNTWDLNGFNQTVAGLANLNGIQSAGLNIITNSGTTDSVLTLSGTTDRSFTGIFTDGATHKLAVVKNGTYKQTLTGSSTHTGGTTIHAGTLAVTSATTFADASAISLDSTGATLELAFTGTDTVAQLFIGGVQMAAGTWGGTGSGAANIDTRFTGSGTLTVTSSPPAGGYDGWAAAKGLTGANNGKGLDPDTDGVTNLAEYALDGDPLSGAIGGKRVVNVATVGSENVLTLTIPVRTTVLFPTSNSGNLIGSGEGVTYTIQASGDLSNWTSITVLETPATGTGSLPTLTSGYSYRTFYVPSSDPALNQKLFMRAVITETP
ncbi:hypothetical protein llg_45860 [Luteolibacter sp. LG18]|nr:hypothetical protein llg_45860 [Luteolibacter sp. LG18]